MTTLKLKLSLSGKSPAKHRDRKTPVSKENQPPKKQITEGRTPRISKLMALAIQMEEMLRCGEVKDLAELALLGHVTQPRVSQILNLTLLAPEIQEELLHLPRVTTGRPEIHEKMLRPIAAEMDWDVQREMWNVRKGGTKSQDSGPQVGHSRLRHLAALS